MKYLIFNLIIFIFINFSTFSQNAEITGKIKNSNNKFVDYFQSAILSNTDSSIFIVGTFLNGNLEFRNIPFGNYVLKITSPEYQTKYIKININTISYDVGTVYLKFPELEEVIITGKRPVFKYENGKIIVKVKGNSIENAGSLKDALKQCPGITVDYAGNINVFGKGTPTIYIDGKEVKFNEAVDVLQSDDIKSIIIDRNPDSEYSASTHSVIKIETLKLKSDILNLSIFDNIKFKRKAGNYSGIKINNKSDRFTNFLSYSYGVFNSSDYKERYYSQILSDYTINSMYNDTLTHLMKFHSLFLGTDYKINNKNIIGFQYSGSIRNINSNTITYKSIVKTNESETNYLNISNSDALLNIHSFDLNYRLKINSNNSFKLNFDYALKDNISNNNISEENRITKETLNTIVNSYDNFKLITIKADYKTKLFNVNTNFGLKYSNTDNRGNATIKDSEKRIITYKTNNRYNDNISAAYITANKKYDKLFLKVGVRYEYVFTKEHLNINNINEVKYPEYSDYFPSLLISYKYFNNDKISLSYARHIFRPSFSTINTHITYFDSLNYSTGNPSLKPEYYNDFEFNISILKNLYFSIDYTLTKNYISHLTMKDERNPEIMKSSFINIDNAKNISAFLNYRLSKKIWSININSGIYKYFIDADYIQYLNKFPYWFISLKNDIKITNNIKLSSTFKYSSSGYSNIFYNYENFYFSPQIYGKFFNKKLLISLLWSDIFKTHLIKFEQNYDNIFSAEKSDYDGLHFVRISVKYYFNNFKNSFSNRAINRNELNRAN